MAYISMSCDFFEDRISKKGIFFLFFGEFFFPFLEFFLFFLENFDGLYNQAIPYQKVNTYDSGS